MTAIGGKIDAARKSQIRQSLTTEGPVANCPGELFGRSRHRRQANRNGTNFRRIPAAFDAIFGHKRLLTITADKALFGNRQLFHEGGSARITAPHI
jgi:hypothetical protein